MSSIYYPVKDYLGNVISEGDSVIFVKTGAHEAPTKSFDTSIVDAIDKPRRMVYLHNGQGRKGENVIKIEG